MKVTRTIYGALALALTLLSACGDQGVVTPEVSPPRYDESCGYLGSNNCKTEGGGTAGLATPVRPRVPLQGPLPLLR